MNLYKYFMLGLTLVLLAATVLFSSGCVDKLVKNPSAELSECIKQLRQGDSKDLSLTIYCMSPLKLTLPISVRDLIENDFEYKITISGGCMQTHIHYVDLLDQVANATLTPIEKEDYLDARIYYVFESKKKGKIFSVCLWSGQGGIFVNGLHVEEKEIFRDVIMPFLPEDVAKALDARYRAYP